MAVSDTDDDALCRLWQQAWEKHFTRYSDPHFPPINLLRSFAEFIEQGAG